MTKIGGEYLKEGFSLIAVAITEFVRARYLSLNM